jgi:AcrR family transcriptional regulator
VSSRPPRSKADDTPALLIEAGIQLFGAKGYDGVTTRELADAAGTNISSIKYHFGSKEALYRAVLNQIVDEITSLIGPLLNGLRTGIAAADGNREVLKRLAEQFVQSWCRVALVDPRTQIRIPPVVREVIQPSRHFVVIYNGFFGVLYDVLGELLAAARGRASVDDELRIQTHVIMNVVWGFIYTQSIFWHQMGWNGYTRERVESIVPILSEAFVQSLGLSDSQIARGK